MDEEFEFGDEKLQESLVNLQNLLKNEKKIAEKNDLLEAIEFIKLVESMKIPQFESIRKKRQAGPVTCASLLSDLANFNNQIAVLEKDITNSTAAIAVLNQKVDAFKFKVSNSTGTSLTLNEKLLKNLRKPSHFSFN